MGGGCCIGICCVGDVPIIRNIKDLFSSCGDCNNCTVSRSSGPSASERHAKKTANELAEMKEKMGASTSEQEGKIMDYINQSMNSFMKEVESLNQQTFGGESLRINVDAINKKNVALKKQVVGCIGTVMNTRLVQTDKELATILAERNDKKRKQNFDRFVEKIKEQAIDKLEKEIEKTVKEQSEVVSSEIKARQKEVNDRLAESIKELTEIMEAKAQKNDELEKKQLGYMYESTLCDFLLREVEG